MRTDIWDVLIVFEDTDIIKLFCDRIVSALMSVEPHPKMERIRFTNLNLVKEMFKKSCKKLIFITDEKFRTLSSRKIEVWMSALLSHHMNDQNTLVLNTNCETDEPAEPNFEEVLTSPKRDKCIVAINKIEQFDCWWPRVIEFVFQINVQGNERITLSFRREQQYKYVFSDLSPTMDLFLNHFKVLREEKTCNVIVSDDIEKEMGNALVAKPYILFDGHTVRCSETMDRENKPMVYRHEDVLKLLLHVLVDFEVVFVSRERIRKNTVQTILKIILYYLFLFYSLMCRPF